MSEGVRTGLEGDLVGSNMVSSGGVHQNDKKILPSKHEDSIGQDSVQ